MHTLFYIIAFILLLIAAPAQAESQQQQYEQAARLAEQGKSAMSFVMLNQLIEEIEAQRMSHADSLLLMRACRLNAKNYQGMGNLTQALRLLQQSMAIARRSAGGKEVAELSNNLFSIYYQRKEYRQAEDLLRASLSLSLRANDSANVRNIYNNLGLVSYELRHFDQALKWMDKALEYASPQDPVGKSLIYTNMAEVYNMQNDYRQTEQNLRIALQLQQGKADPRTLQTQLNMSLLLAMTGRAAESRQLQLVIMRRMPRMPLSTKVNSYEQLAEINFILGDSITGLHHIMTYERLNDSLRHTVDNSQLQQLLVYYDSQRLKESNDNLQSSLRIRNIMFVSATVFLALLALLLVLLIRRMRIDKRKNRLINAQRERLAEYEKQEHERQKQQMTRELDHKNRQLTSYTIDMAAINEFHQKVVDALEDIRVSIGNIDPSTQSKFADLKRQLQHYNDKPVSEDFRVYFDEVHPEFLKKLSANYPQLSKTDLRLCAYLHLGMSTKEIAALTYREVRTIDSQRNRLRKKLALPAEASLQDFLKTFDK